MRKLDVFLEIFGKDSASAVFTKIGEKSAALQGKLGDTVTGSILKANLLGKAADLTLGAVTTSVNALAEGMGAAAGNQSDMLAGVASYSTTAGLSFDLAEESLARINKQLSITADVLPGNTAAYSALAVSITDNVVPAAEQLDGSFDIAMVERDVVSLSESFGALGAQAGVATADISKGLSRALGGGSLSALGELQLFENNPALLSQIEKQLAAANVEALSDLSLSARIGLIKSVGEAFITDEFKTAASESVDGLVESFRTTLFDPTRGIFSITRDVDLDTVGNQSLFENINQGLFKIIGPGGILAADGPLARVMEALGIELPDPMKYLYELSVGAVEGIQRMSDWLDGLADSIQSGLGVAEALTGLFSTGLSGQEIGRLIGQLYGTVTSRVYDMANEFLKSFPAIEVGEQIGDFLGSGAVNLFLNFPWLKVAEFVGRFTLVIGDVLANALVKTFESAAEEIARWAYQGIKAALDSVNPAAIAGNAVRSLVGNRAAGGGTTSVSRGRGRTAASLGVDAASVRATRVSRRPSRSRDSGQYPFALSPNETEDILVAATEEKRANPGASVVVANSSERIIPRGGNIGSVAAPSRQPANISISFSPTVMLGDRTTKQAAMDLVGQLAELTRTEMERVLV